MIIPLSHVISQTIKLFILSNYIILSSLIIISFQYLSMRYRYDKQRFSNTFRLFKFNFQYYTQGNLFYNFVTFSLLTHLISS